MSGMQWGAALVLRAVRALREFNAVQLELNERRFAGSGLGQRRGR